MRLGEGDSPDPPWTKTSKHGDGDMKRKAAAKLSAAGLGDDSRGMKPAVRMEVASTARM